MVVAWLIGVEGRLNVLFCKIWLWDLVIDGFQRWKCCKNVGRLKSCLGRWKEWNFEISRKLLVAIIGEDFVILCYYYIVLSSIIS